MYIELFFINFQFHFKFIYLGSTGFPKKTSIQKAVEGISSELKTRVG